MQCYGPAVLSIWQYIKLNSKSGVSSKAELSRGERKLVTVS